MKELCNFNINIYCWFDRELGCTIILHLLLDLTESFLSDNIRNFYAGLELCSSLVLGLSVNL